MLLKQLAIFCLAFVLTLLVSDCAHGPVVTVCVVDSQNQGYQCRKNDGKDKGHFVSFLQAQQPLECASPADTELFIKNCQQHIVVPITYCRYLPRDSDFGCTSPEGASLFIKIQDADNYVCMSPLDEARVLQRCH